MTKGVKNRVTIVPSCHFGYSERGHIRHIIFGLFWKSSLSLIVYPPSNLELDCIKLVDFAPGVLWKFVRFLVEYSWSKRVPIFMHTVPWLLCMVALEAHFVNGWRYGPIYMCFVMCESILRLFADY